MENCATCARWLQVPEIKENSGYRFTIETKRALRKKMVDLNLRSVQQVIDVAVQDYLGIDHAGPGELTQISNHGKDWAFPMEHDMLEEILTHGEPEAGWITGNLKTFVEKIRRDRMPRRKMGSR